MQRDVAWIHGDQAKSTKAIGVPLNEDALAILAAQFGKHHTRVFTYNGKPVAKAGTAAWCKALKRAGIKSLGGGTNYEMLQRYAWLA